MNVTNQMGRALRQEEDWAIRKAVHILESVIGRGAHTVFIVPDKQDEQKIFAINISFSMPLRFRKEVNNDDDA
jgi:hypothetical protein